KCTPIIGHTSKIGGVSLLSKFTREEKHQFVDRYLNGSNSYRGLASEIGIDDSVLRYWVMLVKYHGDQAFIFPYTIYSPAFKLKVIQFIKESGYSNREASAIFHLPDPSMVRKWKKKVEVGGIEALKPKEKGLLAMISPKKKAVKTDHTSTKSVKELEQEIFELRMENAYLKKLKALVQEEQSQKKLKR
ncbi:helix-turn-helix domain-containing protein, partial [Bacillus timonensis]|nr:helix-turn-helix domain-containing protein [Bacillus timonensis]